MASSGGNGMPEVQLRLSKKIAELTKVIYNLNNQIDDPSVELKEVADEYGAELELILKDAAQSVTSFKGYLDAPNNEAQSRSSQLEAKLEGERVKWQEELESVRRRAADKELAIQKAASRQIDHLQSQVQQLQAQLQSNAKEVEPSTLGPGAGGDSLSGVTKPRPEGPVVLQLRTQLAAAQARIRTLEANPVMSELTAELSEAQEALGEAQNMIIKAHTELDRRDAQLAEKDRIIQDLQRQLANVNR